MTLQRGVRGPGSFDQTRTLPRKLSEYRPPLSYEDGDVGGFYDYNGEEYAKDVEWRGEDGVGGPCGEEGSRDPLLQASISSLLLAAHQESVLWILHPCSHIAEGLRLGDGFYEYNGEDYDTSVEWRWEDVVGVPWEEGSRIPCCSPLPSPCSKENDLWIPCSSCLTFSPMTDQSQSMWHKSANQRPQHFGILNILTQGWMLRLRIWTGEVQISGVNKKSIKFLCAYLCDPIHQTSNGSQ